MSARFTHSLALQSPNLRQLRKVLGDFECSKQREAEAKALMTGEFLVNVTEC